MTSHYLPMKILPKLYADKLLYGEVFMREMREFGVWSTPALNYGKSIEELKNGMRTDWNEGACCIVQRGDEDPFGVVKSLPDDFRSAFLHISLIEENQKYTKLFCMSKLEYDVEIEKFIPPHSRIDELGDTVIILIKPHEFFARLQSAFTQKYANLYHLSAGEVTYCKLFGQTMKWDAFTKPDSYAWQNEVRITAELRDDIIVTDDTSLNHDSIINIGDISDIAIAVPVENICKGIFPSELYTEDTLQLVKNTVGMPMGLTINNVSIGGNFMKIGPYREWIDCLQSVFPIDEWSAVTYMEKLALEGKALPRLRFVRKIDFSAVSFGVSQVVFETVQSRVNIELIQSVLSICQPKVLSPLNGISVMSVYNFGNVSDNYSRYDSLYTAKRYQKDNYQISESIETGMATEVNLFGVNCDCKKWRYDVTVTDSNQFSTADITEHYENIWSHIDSMVNRVSGDEIYERFCSL